ncbi:hypothetical protein [Sporosarcina sp. FSL K6-1508]|uniref:hypothetical protein n=1 Tax=Sporosarcina sp. FSL K6-1508 TaxID=2921553 RepID=UPI0030FC1DD9
MLKWRRKESRKKNNERYTIGDFFMDLLLWIPELLFLPFRLLFIGVRTIFRFIDNF